MRLRLVVPGARRGRGLGGLKPSRRRAVGLALGLGWILAGALALVLVLGRGGAAERPATPPPPAPLATATPAPGGTPAPAETQVQETDGRLAVGITEPNPNFLAPPGTRQVPEPFARWRDALSALRPAYYRLVLDWPSLQPEEDVPANFDLPSGGCMRDVPPCAPFGGLRDQLRTAAARQRATGMEVLVVITGAPDWAGRPPRGCERAGIGPRSRPPREDALPAYRQLVVDTLRAAADAGVELRYWSAWNEPNHPYFLSPQRPQCSGGAPSAAVGPYVAMARALEQTLDAAPGAQEYVLGELAASEKRKPRATAVEEFAQALPDDLVCGAAAWSQHGYVGGPDPVDSAAAGLQGHECPTAPEIWITETGVGAPRLGSERNTSARALRRACRAMHRRLERWYEDPRVTAAFQYTLREDDRFPTGLVNTALSDAYPVLGAWQAWGGTRPPEAPAPVAPCP